MVPDDVAPSVALNVLVVSDEPATIAFVADTLSSRATQIATCADVQRTPANALHDVAFVDCGAASVDGPAVVRLLRRRWPMSAIVCLRARSEAEAVELLRVGADTALPSSAAHDYVAEVVRAAARRMSDMNAQLRITFGDLVYDREGSRLWCAGREVELTRREMQVFDCLFVHAERPVSVATLQDYVWREEVSSGSNPVAVYVRYLRRKLTGSRLAAVATLRGRGYQLTRRSLP